MCVYVYVCVCVCVCECVNVDLYEFLRHNCILLDRRHPVCECECE
jgi:hypothetical protein